MLLDSIQGVNKVVNGGSLHTLWTKYGKWESEGPSLFAKRAVLRETGDRRASPGIDVPTSCCVLKLSEDDRIEHDLAVSHILVRDDYRQALDDICYFATHNDRPPSHHNTSYPSGELKNPFFNTEPSNITAAVTLLGHPGIGKQFDDRRHFVISHLAPMIREKPLGIFSACTSNPRRTSNYLPLPIPDLLRL